MKKIILLLCAVCFLTPPAVLDAVEPAVPAAADPSPRLLQENISLDLRNIDVVDALKFLSTKANLNIVTTKSVTGRVTLMVQDAPVKDVFDIMLRSNDLAFDVRAGIYNVMTTEEYRALYGKTFSDIREVKVIKLSYSIPEQAFSLLDMLKSEVGRVMVDPDSGSVMVMDSPAKIAQMEKVLKDFEKKNVVKVFGLNYAKAKDVEEALKTQLDAKKVGMIKADEKGNQVIVQTLPERMNEIESLIAQLDKKTKELIIDGNIVQVKLSDEVNEGVKWEGIFDLGRKFGASYMGSYPFSSVQASSDAWRSRSQALADNDNNIGSIPFTGTTSNYSGGKQSIGTQEMHLGIIGNSDFDVILNYIQSVGKTKILSNPKIAVVNNQEAKIHVGQKEAYVTTTTTTGQTTNTVSEQVNFVDVGVIISVVPAINDDNFITLKIKTEINSVIDTLITPTENKIPIIDTSLAETTVMVKDASTVIIGGLKKEQEVSSVDKTPVLGDIPFLGRLFKVSSKQKQRSELLIIMTPRIISGEVFVTDVHASDVGQQNFKPLKGYVEPLTRQKTGPASQEIFLPVTEKEPMQLKGFRK